MAITKTKDGVNLLAERAAVEHLELTGVFAACHAAGVPCGALLVLSNRVGPEAHQEWKANNVRVSQELVKTLIRKGVLMEP
jgi:purine-nucleoside phosphorylase